MSDFLFWKVFTVNNESTAVCCSQGLELRHELSSRMYIIIPYSMVDLRERSTITRLFSATSFEGINLPFTYLFLIYVCLKCSVSYEMC